MELLIRWVFSLVVVAAHWASGNVGFEDPLRPWPQGLAANQPQVRPPGPVFVPQPTFGTPRPPMFVIMKPQKLPTDYYPVRPTDYPPARTPGYPMYKPWRVPTNTQMQSGQSQNLPQTQPTQLPQPNPSQLPSKAPGQFAAYWVQVPSYYLNLGQPKRPVFGPTVAAPATNLPNYPFLQVPGNSFQSQAMRLLSNPNVLPSNVVKPRKDVPGSSSQLPAKVYLGQPVNPPSKKQVGDGFVNYGKPHVPKSPQDVKGPPMVNQDETVKMSDYPNYPNYPHYPPYNLIPHIRYLYSWYPHAYPPPPASPASPAEKPAYSVKGPPVLQKQQQPVFEWSHEEGQWIPVFSSQ